MAAQQKTLNDMFLDTLKDTYYAEKEILKALPKMADAAAASGEPLPASYHRLFWTWFAFGFPAFAAVLGIF